VKPKRLGDWKRQADRAYRALLDSEWWDGKRWRPDTEYPRPGDTYRTADDVLAEAVQATVGKGPVNGTDRMAAARRFARSAEADHEWTPAELEAHEIFKLARPLLRRKPFRNRPGFSKERTTRTAWTALATYLSGVTGRPITPNRLRMICRQRGAK